MSKYQLISVLIAPDPKCKIGCNGNGIIKRMYNKEYKDTICACVAVAFYSDDLEETLSAIQDAVLIQLEEKDAKPTPLDKSTPQPEE